MNDYDREDFEYLLELVVAGLVFDSDWYLELSTTEPARADWLVALVNEMVHYAVIDKTTVESPCEEANRELQRIMCL